MLIKSALRDWLSVSYVTQYPVPPIISFPLEGKSREAGKGVRGRAPIGCSIAVLTANRRPPERRAIRHRIRVSYSFLPPSIPSPLRGPLPLKGTQERYGIYFSASYVMKSITVISHLRWLFPPLVPYGTTFPPHWEACHTILRSLCSLTNRVPLPPRYRSGDKRKAPLWAG